MTKRDRNNRDNRRDPWIACGLALGYLDLILAFTFY